MRTDQALFDDVKVRGFHAQRNLFNECNGGILKINEMHFFNEAGELKISLFGIITFPFSHLKMTIFFFSTDLFPSKV